MIYKIIILQELRNLVQINEDDIEEKVQSNTADLEVRKTKINFVMLVSTCFLSFQILNTKVIFNAQVTQGYSEVTGYLTFDEVDVNIGDAFDGSSGIFKVPISGTYKMTFSGHSANDANVSTNLHVYKNGSIMFSIYDGNAGEKGNINNLSYTWIMTLVQGDELKLNSGNYLYANPSYPLTFTGQLIHIEN